MEGIEKNYKIAVLGSEALSLGLRIAGVTESHVVEQSADGEVLIKKLLERDDIGIIVIATRLVKGIKDRRLYDKVTSSIMPLFMQVADYNEDMRGEEDSLRRLIIRALGIDIGKNI